MVMRLVRMALAFRYEVIIREKYRGDVKPRPGLSFSQMLAKPIVESKTYQIPALPVPLLGYSVPNSRTAAKK